MLLSFYFLKNFPPQVYDDDFSQVFKWQQVSLSLQDSSQYSG